MNKIKLALLVSGALFAGSNAFAEGQGTVTFDGLLITETCVIEPADKDQTVTLPAVSIKTLDVAGKEGGYTPFKVRVTCPTPKISDALLNNEVAMNFEPTGATTAWDPATGNLKNSLTGANDAKNVQVKIITGDGNSTQIKIGDHGQWVKPDAAGKVEFKYFGGYYATGVTTAGKVAAKVMYTLVYQ
ncbi:fimbrial protein [Morganella psychrotolerans]|uniref:fimbrial protein n=1 Tax=Morganella psychrotolerans TaxID=368603 RepID=UPI0039AEA797